MLGAAAAVATSAMPGVGEAAPARTKRPLRPATAAPERPAAIEAEVVKQKHATGDLLKTIRDYELPAGSEMAFVFAPSKAPKRATGGGAR